MTNETSGTTWQGIACAPGIRKLLEVTAEEMASRLALNQGQLAEVIQKRTLDALNTERNMLLCRVDEIERMLGYDDDAQQPRTSEIRSYWKDSGRPRL